MKLRLGDSDSNLIFNNEQNLNLNLGWEESFQSYEREILEELINPIENYETCRYIHKPYTSNGIEQTDIWFYFHFNDSGTYKIDYLNTGIDQSDVNYTHLKNSFFRLEFYKTPNNEPPNRSNRRLVFAKNLNPVVGEKVTLPSGQKLFVPAFMGSPFKNKENMYLFWFEDDTVLEETTLTGTTFFMTAKFYNAVDGSRIQFANKEITQGSDVVEEDDLYFIVEMDRSNAPSFHYDISDYDSTGNVRGNRRGLSSSPIKFYEIGGNVGSGNTPTPSPSSTTILTPTPSPTVVLTPTPSPSSTPQGAFASWSNGTSNSHSGTIPGDNPSTGTTTGTVTVTGGPVTVKVSSYKPFNYANASVSELIVGSIGTISATNASGNSTTVTSTGQLTLPVGIYPYTINTILTIDGGLTSGAAVSNIVNV